MRDFSGKSRNLYSFSKLQFPNPCNVIDDDVMPKVVEAVLPLDSAVFYALQRCGTPGQALKGGKLDSDGAVGEKESPRPPGCQISLQTDFCLADGLQKKLS